MSRAPRVLFSVGMSWAGPFIPGSSDFCYTMPCSIRGGRGLDDTYICTNGLVKSIYTLNQGQIVAVDQLWHLGGWDDRKDRVEHI